jgi:CheY-like chemotaxis protein
MSEQIGNAANPVLVVLVEDEYLVRANALQALVEAGFDVVEAADSDQAMAALEADAGSVRVLFTDVQMPGGSMDGLALAHHTRQKWPWIAVAIASGNAAPIRAEVPEGCRLFAKPYALRDVVAHLQALTGSRH